MLFLPEQFSTEAFSIELFAMPKPAINKYIINKQTNNFSFLLTVHRIWIWEDENQCHEETGKEEVHKKIQVVEKPAKLLELLLK